MSLTPAAPFSWKRFSGDPRSPHHAGLRLNDHDRDLVCTELAAAYSDGRLDHAEYQERLDRAGQARTIGEIEGLLADLIAIVAENTYERPGRLRRLRHDELEN